MIILYLIDVIKIIMEIRIIGVYIYEIDFGFLIYRRANRLISEASDKKREICA